MVSHLTSDGRPFHDNSNSFFFHYYQTHRSEYDLWEIVHNKKISDILSVRSDKNATHSSPKYKRDVIKSKRCDVWARKNVWEISLRFSFLFFVVFNDWNHRYDLERLSKMFYSMRDSLNERIYVFHNDRKIQCHSKCHRNRRPLGGTLLHWRVEI